MASILHTACASCFALYFGCISNADSKAVPKPAATPVESRQVNWKEDFEANDPVEFWATKAKYIVNFKGLTDEAAASGKKSFKLDVTFSESGYFYWDVPVKLPAEGQLLFSGKMLLGKETTGTAGLGINTILPPTSHSGCDECNRISTTGGKWLSVESDVAAWTLKKANNVSNSIAFVEAGNVGRMIDRIGIFLRGNAGQRVVLYVDDLKLEGKIPAAENYDAIVGQRWKETQERMAAAFAEQASIIRKVRTQLAAIVGGDESTARFKDTVSRALTDVESAICEARKKGSISRNEFLNIVWRLRNIELSVNSLQSAPRKEIEANGAAVFVIDNPVNDIPILPNDQYVPGRPGADDLLVTAAIDEYESASIVVKATASNIKGLLVTCGTLRHEDGSNVILPDEIDIRAVKCWYQAGSAWLDIAQDKQTRRLVPELLLKDDSLVRVDMEKQNNYLKLWFPDGAKEVCVSNIDGRKVSIHGVEERPLYDSRTLKALDLNAGSNKQFWITVHVPAYARAGSYTGEITVSGNNFILRKLTLRLHVLPFSLPRPGTFYDPSKEFISSIYYRGKLGFPRRKNQPESPVTLHPAQCSVSSEWKNQEQFRAELRDMIAHNITNPTVYQQMEGLGPVLRIRNEMGLGQEPLFSIGVQTGSPKDEAGLKALKTRVEEMKTAAKAYGVNELYVYGIDEAEGDALVRQREAWKVVHEAGAKMFVAGTREDFDKVGDLLDLQVQSGVPSADMAKKWHSLGHRVLSYANPQTGPENPALFRRNFGLKLWKAEYDGAMTYAYQHSFCDIYNDFDDGVYRDHVFSYPTADGVIPTMAIEGYREAIDDIRYATLLKQLAVANTHGPKAALAADAMKYLNTLDLDERPEVIRADVISLILKLMN